jgi:hypothetical protein
MTLNHNYDCSNEAVTGIAGNYHIYSNSKNTNKINTSRHEHRKIHGIIFRRFKT